MDEKEKAQEIQEQAQRKEPAQTASEKPETPEAQAPTGEDSKSPLEEARELSATIKKDKEDLKKLVERQERANADAQIAGKGFVARPQAPQRTPAEQESRDKIKAYGESTGAQWAKEMKD